MGQPPQYFSTQMPPQHAGETSSPVGQAGRAGEPRVPRARAQVSGKRDGGVRARTQSGEKKQPLPTNVPAIISGGTRVPSPLAPPYIGSSPSLGIVETGAAWWIGVQAAA